MYCIYEYAYVFLFSVHQQGYTYANWVEKLVIKQ